jgi:predicted nucleotidyltransferase
MCLATSMATQGQRSAAAFIVESVSDMEAPDSPALQGPLSTRVAALRSELVRVLDRHGVANPQLFGSAARGDDYEGSDVDLLVDLPPGADIIDVIDIQRELEALLGVPVDLVPRDSLKARVRDQSRSDLLPL